MFAGAAAGRRRAIVVKEVPPFDVGCEYGGCLRFSRPTGWEFKSIKPESGRVPRTGTYLSLRRVFCVLELFQQVGPRGEARGGP